MNNKEKAKLDRKETWSDVVPLWSREKLVNVAIAHGLYRLPSNVKEALTDEELRRKILDELHKKGIVEEAKD